MIRKIIFAGTPEFAAASLNAISQAGFEIPLVLTQPDRPKGRGMKMQYSPVKQTALELGLNIAQPHSLKETDIQNTLKGCAADIMVVAAYGLLLPQAVLDIPRFGCLNIHASLLPRWRGAAPIQRAIEAGDQETGICIMQMDAGLDTGAIISRHPCPIRPEDNASTLHDTLMHLGAAAIVSDLQQYTERQAQPQSAEGITYAAKLNKEETHIDWNQAAETLDRKIRALNPSPGTWTTYNGNIIKIRAAKTVNADNTHPGEILSVTEQGITVACGQNALTITEIQAAGGKRMHAAAFSAGHKIIPGNRFGSQ